MKSKLIAFHASHLSGFGPQFDQPGFDSWLKCRALDMESVMVTVVRNQEILGFLGYEIRNKNTVEAWAMFKRLPPQYAFELLKVIQLGVAAVFESGVFRIQALANVESKRAWKFLERIGFQREGLLRGYGPNGEDRYIYSRLGRAS